MGGRTWNIFGHSIPGQWNQTPDRHIIKGLRFRISPTCTLSQNGYGDLRVRRLYIIRLEYSHARKYTDADAVVLRAMLQVREAIVIIYNRRRRAQAPLLPHGCSLPQSIRAFARSRGRRSARSIQNGNGVRRPSVITACKICNRGTQGGGGSLERRGGVLLRRTCMCVCVCVCPEAESEAAPDRCLCRCSCSCIYVAARRGEIRSHTRETETLTQVRTLGARAPKATASKFTNSVAPNHQGHVV